MASSRIVSRLSSRLQLQTLGIKLNSQNSLFSCNASSLLKSANNRRFSLLSRNSFRLPVELSGLETMLPLHSAIASARLKSGLSVESQSWGLIPQGISMPL